MVYGVAGVLHRPEAIGPWKNITLERWDDGLWRNKIQWNDGGMVCGVAVGVAVANMGFYG